MHFFFVLTSFAMLTYQSVLIKTLFTKLSRLITKVNCVDECDSVQKIMTARRSESRCRTDDDAAHPGGADLISNGPAVSKLS